MRSCPLLPIILFSCSAVSVEAEEKGILYSGAALLTHTDGKKSDVAGKDDYVKLSAGIINKAYKQGEKGKFTIECKFEVQKNKQWTRVWTFGDSKVKDKEKQTLIMLLTSAKENELRLTTMHKGVYRSISSDILVEGKIYTAIAAFENNQMSLTVNGKFLKKVEVSPGLNLGTFVNTDNWIGRAYQNSTLFDGIIHSFVIKDH